MTYLQKSLIWISTISLLFILYSLSLPIENYQSIAILAGVCFLSELIDSSLGMGYGTMLTPLLLLIGYTPKEIIPNLLVSELFTGFSAAFFHHEIKNFEISLQGKHLKIIILLVSGSLLGVFSGVWISISIPPEVIVILIGCIVIFSGLVVLLFYNKVIIYKNWKIVLLSIIASFNKAFSGGGYGPLVTSGQILSGVEGKSSIAISSLSEGFTCLFGVILFYLYGIKINIVMLFPMIAGALSSVPFSAFIVSQTQERHLRVVVGGMTLFLGIYTVYSVVNSWI